MKLRTGIEVEGRERQRLLKKASRKMKDWDLKMPGGIKPLVLHFGLDNFSETGHIEYCIVNEEKQRYCGKFIFMFKGQTCPDHYHKMKHETFMIIKGEILMHLKNRTKRMKAGDILPMHQKTSHSFTAARDSLILEVSLPSAARDNFFSNKKIGVI